jgi:hypothetical protein
MLGTYIVFTVSFGCILKKIIWMKSCGRVSKLTLVCIAYIASMSTFDCIELLGRKYVTLSNDRFITRFRV